MEAMEIKPFIGIGDIVFGKSRRTIRDNLGSDFTSFKKTSFSVNETDAYDSIGIYLYYDENDCLNFFELFPPFLVTFKGVSFFEHLETTLIQLLKDNDVNLTPNSVGYDAPDFGFRIYINEGKIDGVCVYKKNYYKNWS
jgi:hypothetical protein